MAAIVLIKPQIEVVTTKASIRMQGRGKATLIATNLGASEAIPVFFTVDDGATFEPVEQDGSAVELTATNNVLVVEASMEIAVTKPVTSLLVGVFLASNNQQ